MAHRGSLLAIAALVLPLIAAAQSPHAAPHAAPRPAPQATPLPALIPDVVPPRWATTTAPLALTGVTVVDVRDGQRHAGQTVVITDNRIRAIGPTGHLALPARTRTIAANGKYLIPGLWDLHVHPMWQQDVADLLFIANGVTGVRDAGSGVPLATMVRRKQETAIGTRVGPRQIVSGPAIIACDNFRTEYHKRARSHHVVCVSTPEEGRMMVDMLKAAGADMIKSYEPPAPIFFEMAAEAQRVGILLGGHLSAGVKIEEASDSGQRIIDHERGTDACSSDLAVCTAIAEHLKRNNSWVLMGPWSMMTHPSRVTPEIVRARERYIPAWQRHATTDTIIQLDEPFDMTIMEKADLPVVFGTDIPFLDSADNGKKTWNLWGVWMLPGFDLHSMMEEAVEHKFSPLRTLQAATINAARAIGAQDSLGTIEVGKVADLVLLDGDPLVDMYNVQKIHAVVANGRYYDRRLLDAVLAQSGRGK